MPRSAAGRADFIPAAERRRPGRSLRPLAREANKWPGALAHRASRIQDRSAIAPVSRSASGRLLVLLVIVDLGELRVDDVFLGFALGCPGVRARAAAGSGL